MNTLYIDFDQRRWPALAAYVAGDVRKFPRGNFPEDSFPVGGFPERQFPRRSVSQKKVSQKVSFLSTAQ